MKALPLILALALAGCASAPKERIVYREVIKPVPVPCLTEPLPDREAKETDALDLSAASLHDKVKAILIDRERDKIARLNERSLLKACGG